MDITFGGLEIFMIICAVLTTVLGIIAPIINKKSALSTVSCIYTSLICAAYFTLCPFMLSFLESDAFYGIPVDAVTGGRERFVTVFFSLIFIISLVGFILPIISKLKSVKKHSFKLFVLYIIISTSAFGTIMFSLMNNYKDYILFTMFLPLHWILPISVYSISVCNFSKKSHFVISLAASVLTLGVAVAVSAMAQWTDATPLQVIICIMLIITPILSAAAAIYEKFKANKTTLNVRK